MATNEAKATLDAAYATPGILAVAIALIASWLMANASQVPNLSLNVVMYYVAVVGILAWATRFDPRKLSYRAQPLPIIEGETPKQRLPPLLYIPLSILLFMVFSVITATVYMMMLGASVEPLPYSQAWPGVVAQFGVVAPLETIAWQIIVPFTLIAGLEARGLDRQRALMLGIIIGNIPFAIMHVSSYGGWAIGPLLAVYAHGCLWSWGSYNYGVGCGIASHAAFNCIVLGYFSAGADSILQVMQSLGGV